MSEPIALLLWIVASGIGMIAVALVGGLALFLSEATLGGLILPLGLLGE